MTVRSRKLSHSASYWFRRSWPTCIWMSHSRHTSFHDVTVVHSHLECGLYSTSLSPLLKHTAHSSLCSQPQFGLHKHSAAISECHWMQSFPHGGIQWHNFASSALPCQARFCQSAHLLRAVTQQQNGMGYWWGGSASTAAPPTSTSYSMGQHSEKGGAALYLFSVLFLQHLYKRAESLIISAGFHFCLQKCQKWKRASLGIFNLKR